jgi:DNA repair photolyase
MTGRQLLLGDVPRANLSAGRPGSFGLANLVTYGESASILRPASGFMSAYKFTLNPYGGCGFGCDYCYARFFASTKIARDTWGEWINVKQNAVEAIERASRSRSLRARLSEGDSIYMSSVTDPYQPLEAKLELTRDVLNALIPIQPRLTVQTRSPLVVRDIDLLRQFHRRRVNITIPTDDDETRSKYEPHCPSIDRRFKALEELRANGIPIGVSVSPLLPLRNAAAFGRRLAELDATEYVAQPLKPPRGHFSAGTGGVTTALAAGDKWGAAEYGNAVVVIRSSLRADQRLLEGAAGYSPA